MGASIRKKHIITRDIYISRSLNYLIIYSIRYGACMVLDFFVFWGEMPNYK